MNVPPLARLLAPRLPFFYGWVVLGCLCLSGLARQGPAVATLSIFVVPMTTEFGWSRTAIAGAVSLGGVLAALIAPPLGGAFGQQFVVDNRGLVAVDMAAKSAPDGYTLISYGPPLWLTPLLRPVAYDAVRDFAPITLAGHSPNVLVVHPSLPVKSVRELVLLAKKRPGELNYSSSSTGASPHLAAELDRKSTRLNSSHVSESRMPSSA